MSARRAELDATRGLMLVWMTLTHLPTNASAFANQTIGFVSSAEGFIFFSALFTGLIYFRVAQRDGIAGVRRKLWLRTLRLYGYHVLLLAFAFLVAVPIAAKGNRPHLHDLLDYYFMVGAKHAIVDSALLIYRPPLLDILPMYIVFLFFTPLILATGIRKGWKWVLAGSFVLWVGAQLGLREAVYRLLVHTAGLQIPLNEMGSFDLWGWQFLWALGLWFGVRWAQDELPVQDWAKRLLIPAAAIATLLMGLRYAVGNGVELGRFEVCFDKWHLGLVRLINFAAIAALLIRFPWVLQKLSVRPLVQMGQASLQVFCAHLLFCFAGLTLMGNASMLQGWQQIILAAITFSGLWLTAKMFSKDTENRKLVLQKSAPSDGFGRGALDSAVGTGNPR
ncbi:MAG TPA: OpgC domain-containing protein [Terriglobales bacterium]|nr:OpgC domain-containing protein [Terriglobales bacterium]